MKEALPYIFMIGAVVAFVAAVVCLITPRAAIFFRNRTRLKGAAAWLAISVACLVLMGALAPEDVREAAKAKRAAQVEAAAEKAKAKAAEKAKVEAAEKAKAEAAEKAKAEAEAQKPRLVPYREEELDDTSNALRKRGSVRIVLADPAADFRPQDLAATCMAAAKFYAKAHGWQMVEVFVSDIPGQRHWQGTLLARCNHAPDKKGISGDEHWQWADVMAAERPLMDQERQVKQLWGELEAKGVRKEADIKKSIGAKLGIPADKVSTPLFILERVDFKPLENVKPRGPVE